jgi:hypothetical protein
MGVGETNVAYSAAPWISGHIESAEIDDTVGDAVLLRGSENTSRLVSNDSKMSCMRHPVRWTPTFTCLPPHLSTIDIRAEHLSPKVGDRLRCPYLIKCVLIILALRTYAMLPVPQNGSYTSLDGDAFDRVNTCVLSAVNGRPDHCLVRHKQRYLRLHASVPVVEPFLDIEHFN